MTTTRTPSGPVAKVDPTQPDAPSDSDDRATQEGLDEHSRRAHLGPGQPGMLTKVFATGRVLRMRRIYTDRDDGGFTSDPVRDKTRWFKNAKSVRAYFEYVPNEEMYGARDALCRGHCCAVEVDEPEYHCRVDGYQLKAVCWWIVSSTKAVPYRIKMEECSGMDGDHQ